MLAFSRPPASRLPSLFRATSSAINSAGASLSSTEPSAAGSSSAPSSSTPRSPRPRRPSNVPQIEVDYSRPHVDLVAQPDPISNLRPILYQQTNTPPAPRNPAFPPRKQPVPRPSHHSPRSETSLTLAEFQHGPRRAPEEVFYRKDEFPRQGDETEKTKEYRVVREALDEYNQAFWASNNTRYHLGLNAELAKLSPSDPPTHADDEARIQCVDAWNARWIEQEGVRQRKWMKEWWGGQIGVLKAWWAMMREAPK